MVLFTVHIPIVSQAQRMAHKIGFIDGKNENGIVWKKWYTNQMKNGSKLNGREAKKAFKLKKKEIIEKMCTKRISNNNWSVFTHTAMATQS